jgi:pyrroloquinoline quinone biosynthesis protein B
MRVFVLGTAQDGSFPSIKQSDEGSSARFASCIGVEVKGEGYFLLDASPDIRQQVQLLAKLRDAGTKRSLEGREGGPEIIPLPSRLFITHAHYGHIGGVLALGREAGDSRQLPTYVPPGLAKVWADEAERSTSLLFGPLVARQHLNLLPLPSPLQLDETFDWRRERRGPAAVAVGDTVTVLSFGVPHRDEIGGGTVGFLITTPDHCVAYLPDIDDYVPASDRPGHSFGLTPPVLAHLIRQVDILFLDGTFFSPLEKENIMAGRDVKVPHPSVTESMRTLDPLLTRADRAKVHFTHFNCSNPLLWTGFPGDEMRCRVPEAGYRIATQGEVMSFGPEEEE